MSDTAIHAEKDKSEKPKPRPPTFTEDEAQFLGYGIDLFEFDPWNPASKSRILVEPIETEFVPIRTQGYTDIYEDSFLKMTQKLAVEAGLKGSYGDFSGNVSTKFSKSDNRTEKRHMQKISFIVSGKTHSLKSTRAHLKDTLDPNFKTALATMDIADLFRDYGTHVANKLTMGGRAEYYCETSDIFSMTRSEFETEAAAKFKTAGGKVEGKNKNAVSNSKTEKLVLAKETIDTIGGSAKASADIKEGGWAAWAASTTKEPGFLGFDAASGLIPIWDLTDNQARRAAIREAYQKKAAQSLTTHIISVTSKIDRRPEASVKVPEGYKLLSGGALLNWSHTGSLLTASFPDAGAPGESTDTWTAAGKEHFGELDGWTWGSKYFPEMVSITVFAIALYDPDDIWEVKTVYFDDHHAATEVDPFQEIDISQKNGNLSALSAEGFVMAGGGAKVSYASLGSLLFKSYPKNETAWRSYAKWHLLKEKATLLTYVTAIKSKVKGVKVLSRITSKESPKGVKPTAAVTVASGYKMSGGGARMHYHGEGMLLTASYPKGIDTWEGRGKDHGVEDKGTIEVYCIGLKVAEA